MTKQPNNQHGDQPNYQPAEQQNIYPIAAVMVIGIKKAAQIKIIPNTTELATHTRARQWIYNKDLNIQQLKNLHVSTTWIS